MKAIAEVMDVENRERRTVGVEQGANCVLLSFDGYGEKAAEVGDGSPVVVEYRKGVPYLIVFADITSEEPTHIISLANASERYRGRLMEIHVHKRIKQSDLSLALFSPKVTVRTPFGEGVMVSVERLLTDGDFEVRVRVNGEMLCYQVEVIP